MLVIYAIIDGDGSILVILYCKQCFNLGALVLLLPTNGLREATPLVASREASLTAVPVTTSVSRYVSCLGVHLASLSNRPGPLLAQ